MDLSQEDLSLLTSLSGSEFRKLLNHISRTDEQKAAQLLSVVSKAKYQADNKYEVADFFGVSFETIDLWAKKGMPYESTGRGRTPGKYDLSVCAQWLAKQRMKISSNTKAETAEAELKESKAAMAALQLKEKEGELVNADEYREGVIRVVSMLQKGVAQFHKAYGNEAVEDLQDLINDIEQTLFGDTEA